MAIAFGTDTGQRFASEPLSNEQLNALDLFWRDTTPLEQRLLDNRISINDAAAGKNAAFHGIMFGVTTKSGEMIVYRVEDENNAQFLIREFGIRKDGTTFDASRRGDDWRNASGETFPDKVSIPQFVKNIENENKTHPGTFKVQAISGVEKDVDEYVAKLGSASKTPTATVANPTVTAANPVKLVIGSTTKLAVGTATPAPKVGDANTGPKSAVGAGAPKHTGSATHTHAAPSSDKALTDDLNKRIERLHNGLAGPGNQAFLDSLTKGDNALINHKLKELILSVDREKLKDTTSPESLKFLKESATIIRDNKMAETLDRKLSAAETAAKAAAPVVFATPAAPKPDAATPAPAIPPEQQKVNAETKVELDNIAERAAKAEKQLDKLLHPEMVQVSKVLAAEAVNHITAVSKSGHHDLLFSNDKFKGVEKQVDQIIRQEGNQPSGAAAKELKVAMATLHKDLKTENKELQKLEKQVEKMDLKVLKSSDKQITAEQKDGQWFTDSNGKKVGIDMEKYNKLNAADQQKVNDLIAKSAEITALQEKAAKDIGGLIDKNYDGLAPVVNSLTSPGRQIDLHTAVLMDGSPHIPKNSVPFAQTTEQIGAQRLANGGRALPQPQTPLVPAAVIQQTQAPVVRPIATLN